VVTTVFHLAATQQLISNSRRFFCSIGKSLIYDLSARKVLLRWWCLRAASSPVISEYANGLRTKMATFRRHIGYQTFLLWLKLTKCSLFVCLVLCIVIFIFYLWYKDEHSSRCGNTWKSRIKVHKVTKCSVIIYMQWWA
jgi:hypothetical protein